MASAEQLQHGSDSGASARFGGSEVASSSQPTAGAGAGTGGCGTSAGAPTAAYRNPA